MKRFITILVSALIILQSSAFAAYEIGTEKDEIIVSGTAAPNSIVSFALLDATLLGGTDAASTVAKYQAKVDSGATITKDDIFYFRNLETDKDGKWSYVVPMSSGEYTKNLTLMPSVGEPEFIEYGSVEFKKKMIPTLISAAKADENGEALEDKLSFYIGYIFEQKAEYESVENKRKIAKMNQSMIKELSASDETALTKIKQGLKEAIFVLNIEEGIESDYDVMMSVVDYDENVKTSKTDITDTGKEKIVSNLAEQKYDSYEEYKTEAKNQFYMNLFIYNKNGSAQNLLTVLEDVNEVLELENITKLDNLSLAGKQKAAKQLAAKKDTSLVAMDKNLKTIAEAIYLEENPKNSGGGSSGGGGGNFGGGTTSISENKSSYGSGATSVSNQNVISQKYIYEDMNQADWAVDAIYSLANDGIVAGYEDKTFRPLNPITRAEFTKLVVMTFFGESEASGEVNFSDVASDEWYADYVNIAFENGVVSGDDNGKFNPDETISRQDMAVIIYNAGVGFGLFEDISSNGTFFDDASISDYAKKAVYTLKNMGVINGVGEGYFAPLENANRASAAKIIYEFIQNNIK